ncbi:redox-sensitive transcriptional activator SoxR [Streptomyces sp. WAC 04229]|uniref:redox-sensitive transcriptional activator SoxR n=1 Tax=Streptomyces sp. WAC 04229 TaxID=2203206 RepID=UPI003D73732A
MEVPPYNAKELTVGELAERSGVATSALRFYESMGLIHSRRTSGNQRRYPRATLRQVALVRVAQSVGISLREVQETLARLPEGHTPTQNDWEELSRSWRDDLDARIEQLTRLRDRLDDCIGCGCLSLDRCMVANPKDQLGQVGPGPRRLLVDRFLDPPAHPHPSRTDRPPGTRD